MKQPYTSLIIAGAAPDTGNHGVTALSQSAVIGLQQRGVSQFTILDHGRGLRPGAPDGWRMKAAIARLALKGGRRIHTADNMHNARLRQMFRLSAPILNTLAGADAMLDVSGGDSFTDLYGPRRFEQIVLPKMMALDSGTPLILMPQTYGPFHHAKTRALAQRIIRRATMAYARDINSFERLKTLLGADFDPAKHRLGVDLAFGLPSAKPARAIEPGTVGINVSGLLWNDPDGAAHRFGLTADYRAVLIALSRHVLAAGHPLLLVPHVTPENGGESDLVACRALKAVLQDILSGRHDNAVTVCEDARDPISLKGVIAETCWFTGARMHATIAALSSATPVANMAYSGKARGVFDCYGAADQVFDMRSLSTGRMTEALIDAFEDRDAQRTVLETWRPFAERRWTVQMDTIAEAARRDTHIGETADA